jgi:hypothetical protein
MSLRDSDIRPAGSGLPSAASFGTGAETIPRRASSAARFGALAAAVLCGPLVTGCAKKVVAAPPEPPPLSVPAVPPRLVGPVVVEEVAPEPIEDAPLEPARRTTTRTPRVASRGSDGNGAKPAESGGSSDPAGKPEGATAEQPQPEQPAAPLLRTPETADDHEAIKRVKAILGRAEQNLSKVNYQNLSLNAKAQHDTATRFISQAEENLKTRSFTIARFLADKAETISGSLLNR